MNATATPAVSASAPAPEIIVDLNGDSTHARRLFIKVQPGQEVYVAVLARKTERNKYEFAPFAASFGFLNKHRFGRADMFCLDYARMSLYVGTGSFNVSENEARQIELILMAHGLKVVRAVSP